MVERSSNTSPGESLPKRQSRTKTSSFGVSRRESHDSSGFYTRGLVTIEESTARGITPPSSVDEMFVHSAESMHEVADDSVALMITSPPYHVGKDYDSDSSFEEYLGLLEVVFAETYRKLQPGGRAVVNVANLGRRPYVPLSHLVTQRMLTIGYLMRGEVIWRKAKGAAGNCAWGSWRSAANPVIRDVHEYCLIFSKGRFDRVVKGDSTIASEDFMEATLSIWEIPAESAKRVNHPAPFPVALPRRFIELYTYKGEVVLDPFMGSGSTAVAAVETDRHWVGYELSEEYAEITRKRAAEAHAALPLE
jgi:site-specific DNA-methyltransferase (adenine-specific)